MTTSTSTRLGKTGRVLGIGGIAALLMASAACGGSDGASSDGASGGAGKTTAAQVKEAAGLAEKAQTAPTQINSTVPLAKAPEAGTKAVYLLDPNPANTLIGKSFQEAVESAGWDAEQIPYNVADPATVQAALKTALSKGAKFVGEAGLPADVFGDSVIKSYTDADAKIVIGSIFPKANTETINTDAGGGEARYETGKALASWFVSDSDGKGKAIVQNLSAYPILAEFVRGFTDEVDRLCPGCSVEVAKFTPSDLAGGKINPALVSKLRADRSVGYLFFDNSGFATGIDSALKAAGLTKVKVGGSGIDSNAVASIKKGTQHAWIGTSWFYQGYAMADAAFRLQTGTQEGSEQNGDQPFQLFTKDNIDQLDGEYDAPKDALAQFQKLWNVTG
ncbi:sugar ABC transporter substrate-binding protein [Aeromicrobium sp. UC242_57]|uniref:sugar ABC transporter substrate-binding protein n=1 Tax=Aeromicrobium sp. UC242_57 TaxID=3374624 RepID=UPI00379B0114